MLKRIKQQGLDITPRIIIVSFAWNLLAPLFFLFGDIVPHCDGLILFFPQLTRLLPDAVGTTCGERLEKVYNTEYSHILRVPFRTEKGIVRRWISRFEVWPYLETYAEVNFLLILSATIFCFLSDKCSVDFWFLLVLGSKKYQFFFVIRMRSRNFPRNYTASLISSSETTVMGTLWPHWWHTNWVLHRFVIISIRCS